MYRKMFTGMICLMLLGTFFVPKGRADESDKKTIVTETHLITTVQGISDSRMETPDKTILQFEDHPSSQPVALKAWFYPGDNSGVEFVYPNQKN